MDWYSWLSKSGLDPVLVYEYSILFSDNELEEDDTNHFDHEFLQSMGIAIAKHRLEILKLAKKHKSKPPPRPVARLLAVIERTKKSVTSWRARSFINRDNSAVAVVARHGETGVRVASRGAAMLRRNKKLLQIKQGGLLLTDGRAGVTVASSPARTSRGGSPVRRYKDGENSAEKIRWDSMFQDLKPT
ncbi:hypothetical protein Cni_G00303 [Canna indica]|uniref:SAM domain-containing protein n=1 Tax=Canna indica TaxID=4628 RepID=A0AAQ3Q056_9LILI|nr:hypothetical protein Cni_G00303 [Canna indica]